MAPLRSHGVKSGHRWKFDTAKHSGAHPSVWQ